MKIIAESFNMTRDVALCFFGITRSLKFTVESINEYVIGELKRQGYNVVIYIHTYSIAGVYNNPRAKEKCEKMDNEEHQLLNPDFIQIDQQEEIAGNLDLLKYRTHPDPWNSYYKTLDNFILAQYSKLQVTNMVEASEKKYEKIIFLRPDVKYLNKLSANIIGKCNDSTICIPIFHRISKYRFNDRFAICNDNNYKYYGKVFNELYEMSKTQRLHSETVLGKLMREKYKLKIQVVRFYFNRVRVSGEILNDTGARDGEQQKEHNRES